MDHAILCTYPVIGDEPFAMVLPDMILNKYTADQCVENLAAMLVRYKLTGQSPVMVEPVPSTGADKYGIVDCNQVALRPGNLPPSFALLKSPM